MTEVQQELYEEFKLAAEKVGAKVFYAVDAQAAQTVMQELLQANGIREVVSVASPLADQLGLVQVITSSGCQLSYDNLKTKAVTADLGITEADYAVAEIGSLCLKDCTDIKPRLVSTLPTNHLALVSAAKLLPNLITCLQKVQEEFGTELPGYLNFITGPSRTADIERVLTIGVHGPKQLFIIVVE